MNWYLKVIKQYADFNGRARRKEFWMFILVSIIISIPLTLIDKYILKSEILGSIYNLGIFIPNLAVSVRRLHDVNKSGWMLLLWFLPIIGWIWLLNLHVTGGIKGENKYGFDPKREGEPDLI